MKQKRQKVEFSLSTVLANTTTKRQLEGFVEEIVLSKIKMQQESEAIKDIVGEAKDSLGIPGKILMKLVREKLSPGAIEEEVHTLDEVQKIADGLGITDSLGNNARLSGGSDSE